MEWFQGKWQPLHTLAASGEFHLLTELLKHNVDINVLDKVCWNQDCIIVHILVFLSLPYALRSQTPSTYWILVLYFYYMF